MAKSPDRIYDELLVLKCQSGDVQSLEKLVDRWNERLRRHAWYLTRETEAASDIVQDAWMDIIRNLRRLKVPGSFRGWAYRIVANKSADWVRRKARQKELCESLAQRNADAGDDGISAEGRASVQSAVRQGIRSLPPGSQQILSMKYLDRMSTKDIAAALGIPTGTVKSRLHHAREKLKQILQRSES